MKQVVIIGAGPSGMMAAIKLKELAKKQNTNIDVTILEKNDRVGRKILSTGNGKCNYSNLNVMPKYYNDESFVMPILESFSAVDLKSFFLEKGLLTKIDSEGRMYPITESASSVLDILRMELHRYDIKVITNYHVKSIKNKFSSYVITDGLHNVHADYVIVATGGLAAPMLGTTGDGYKLLSPYDINISKTYPGLVGIKTSKESIKGLSGLRMKANVSVIDLETCIFNEFGEVQFKDDGISGIVIMNASSKIARTKNPKIILDLMPSLSKEELGKYILNKQEQYEEFEVSSLFVGLLPNIFALKILNDVKVNLTSKIKHLKQKQIESLVNLIKEYPIGYVSLYGYDRAQVTVGGISLNEINDKLELKKLSNVFVCGELLDIDGACGGYNLHFAFASGSYVASQILNR